jgi:5'-3' exonuclease
MAPRYPRVPRYAPQRHHGHVPESARRSLLLDSASLYYRSFYALPDTLVSPDNVPVNAVRGFLDTVAALVSSRGSSSVIACWDDDWRPQWRVDLVPTYKTHRVLDASDADESLGDDRSDGSAEDIPDTLGPQVTMLRQLLPHLGIPVVGACDAEADDVIADLAHILAGPIDIASGDRDLVQLVDDRVTLLFTGGSSASRGGSPWLTLDPATAQERFGVPPHLYADFAILRGDPSDGLPGARGIGEKTAGALIRAFGDLTAIMDAAEDPSTTAPMTPATRRKLLEAAPTLLAAEAVVRLGHVPGRTMAVDVASGQSSGDIGAAMHLATTWGVEAPTRRLVEALQADTA